MYAERPFQTVCLLNWIFSIYHVLCMDIGHRSIKIFFFFFWLFILVFACVCVGGGGYMGEM